MPVTPSSPALSHTRALKRERLMNAALAMLEEGWFPSITELANAAEVSRATAYRYFPSQAALVSAVVDASLGPVLNWTPQAAQPTARMAELLQFAYPQMEQHEGALRGALLVSLQQWADAKGGRKKDEPKYVRGNRKVLLGHAVAPLEGSVGAPELARLKQALSLLYGTETLVVLKDIWGLDLEQIQAVTTWMSEALITATVKGE